MIKTFKFKAFGVEYKTLQFAAIPALAIMNDPDAHPEIVLAQTKVMNISSGQWCDLDCRDAINDAVVDAAGIMPPQIVLRGILRIVGDYNFGFLRSWQSAKIPSRFVSKAQTVSSHNVDPIIVSLTTDKMASTRELEEYYSLEDAFKMFDSVVVKGINSALGAEAAMEKH